MAYSQPPTRSSANQVISADWNSYVRDNFIEVEARKETDYVEATADVTVSATTAASANTVITANAFTPDGATRYRVEWGATEVTSTAAASSVVFHLYENSTNMGRIGTFTNGSAAIFAFPAYSSREYTPTNASKTLSIRAHRVTANWTVQAASGTADLDFPIWMRITRLP